ncbi:MAG: hypothetical protein FWD84_00580 [Oscillospiraceae bacterium]|nr:hypothetical protein [Oscillospiraceae bacterium]
MKKILTLLLILGFIFTLAACNDVDTPELTQAPMETPPVESSYDEEYEDLILQIAPADDALLATFDSYFEMDHPSAYVASGGGISIAIWANIPLQNFSFMTFGNDILGEETIFIPIDTFGTVEELLPGQGFVIHPYIGLGSLPWTGVTFVDPNGVQRYFALAQNQAYPEHGGQWVIWEFENRTDELPADWVAPWETAGETPEENGIASDHVGGVALGLTIERLEYQAGPGPLADVTFLHMVLLAPEGGDTLMIRTFTPLRDFAVILIEHDIGANEDIAVPVGRAGERVGTFLPTEALMISGYMSAGTLPNTGITFLDENGQRFFFFIVQNQGYPDAGAPYLLSEFQLRTEAMPAGWSAPW